jgi:hypothetical protein
MRQLLDIDLLDDEALQGDMALGSLWIVLAGTLLGVLGAAVCSHEPLSLMWFVMLIAISVLVLL